jgi:hypothetical protein
MAEQLQAQFHLCVVQMHQLEQLNLVVQHDVLRRWLF